MAYGMCGVESRFCDDAMPIRSGSRILPCVGFMSVVRTIDLRRSALLCQVCVRGACFPLSSLISGFASGTFFDETGRLVGEKLLCAACAARNAAVSALQGTAVFRSISAAEPGSSSSRRTPFTLTANASCRHHVCGSELRRCLLIFSENCRNRRQLRSIFNPAGGMLCPTSVLIPVTGSTCSETLSSSSPSDDKAVLTSLRENCRTRRQLPSTFQEKGIQRCQTIVSQVMSCAESPLSSTSSSVSKLCVAPGRMGLPESLQTIQPGKAGEGALLMFSLIATTLTVGAVKISTPTLIWAGAEIAKAVYNASKED